MKYIELFEYSIERVEHPHGGQDITVYVNPPASALLTMLQKSKRKKVRYIFYDGDFYFWDAYDANHDEIAPLLGVTYDLEHGDYITMLNREQPVFFSYPESIAEYEQIPYFNANFESKGKFAVLKMPKK